MTIHALANTRWTGTSELWLDPAGNTALTSDCSIAVVPNGITYSWSYEGKTHEGKLVLKADGSAEFTDTFHSPAAMACAAVASPWALVDVLGTYAAGDGPRWGWRITVSRRPDAELVLQMTNITPWGEDGRAVRMICKRA
jgi:hypothetical protein